MLPLTVVSLGTVWWYAAREVTAATGTASIRPVGAAGAIRTATAAKSTPLRAMVGSDGRIGDDLTSLGSALAGARRAQPPGGDLRLGLGCATQVQAGAAGCGCGVEPFGEDDTVGQEQLDDGPVEQEAAVDDRQVRGDPAGGGARGPVGML